MTLLSKSLVNKPEQLTSVKQKLINNKANFALFDTKGLCQNLENAYIAMWRAQQLGEYKDELSH